MSQIVRKMKGGIEVLIKITTELNRFNCPLIDKTLTK